MRPPLSRLIATGVAAAMTASAVAVTAHLAHASRGERPAAALHATLDDATPVYIVSSQYPWQCLDANYDGNGNLGMSTCANRPSQTWYFDSTNGGPITNYQNGMCVTLGATLNSCDGSQNQFWKYSYGSIVGTDPVDNYTAICLSDNGTTPVAGQCGADNSYLWTIQDASAWLNWLATIYPLWLQYPYLYGDTVP